MIRFISSDDVLPLRSIYLRQGADYEQCRFEGDDNPDSFHLGYFIEDKLVSIATFHTQSLTEFPGEGIQLRGMVTAGDFQGKGIGNMLINFAIVYLRGQKTNYLWCNARKIAYHFYSGIGFEYISQEFDISGIGPHRRMFLKIS